LIAGIAVLCVTAAGASAQSPNGKWSGEIRCDKLSFTKGTMKTAFNVTVADGKVTYSRAVYNATGSRVVGTEEGSATVEADGTIKLSAVWKSADANPHYTYTATHNGTLRGAGGALKGTQIWSFDGKTENRACSISLKHGG